MWGCLRGGSGWFTPSAERGPIQSEVSASGRIWHVNLTVTYTFAKATGALVHLQVAVDVHAQTSSRGNCAPSRVL